MGSTVNKHVHFRQIFQMKRDCFNVLYEWVIAGVGEQEFKLEAYINAFLKGKDPVYDAYLTMSGGYISDEVKLEILLCLHGGGDALNLVVIFDIKSCYCRNIMFKVILDWIIECDIGVFNMIKYIGDTRPMTQVSAGFSKRSCVI